IGFMELQAIADLLNTTYLKHKTIDVFREAVCLAHVTSANGKAAGQCLLADTETVAYVKNYPSLGKTLALTSLFMHAGHGTGKGSIPAGMGPTSTLFKKIEDFALQNNFQTLVAKTHEGNNCVRDLFERMGFTPSSPFIA